MSNQNGRIYIDTSTTPHKGISIADIQTVLGSQRNDIGGLITYGAVNMWARYKPIKWSTSGSPVFFPQEAHPSDWNKGIDGDYGIVSNSFSQVSGLYSAIDGDLNGWSYVKDGIVFRFRDFDGYYHYAPNPFSYLFIQADRLSVAPSGTITFQYQLKSGGGLSLIHI